MSEASFSPADLTQMVQAGQLSHRQAIAIFAAVYGQSLPSSALRLPCENCGNFFPLSEAHSYLVWAPHPGHAAVMGFQCDDLQHYGCCEACGRALALRCLDEHILPAARAKRQAVGTALAAAQGTAAQGTAAG